MKTLDHFDPRICLLANRSMGGPWKEIACCLVDKKKLRPTIICSPNPLPVFLYILL